MTIPIGPFAYPYYGPYDIVFYLLFIMFLPGDSEFPEERKHVLFNSVSLVSSTMLCRSDQYVLTDGMDR